METSEKIFSSVRRPSRYTGGEWNSCSAPSVSRLRKFPKPPDGRFAASICLCYPDLYELGASSSGLEILYTAVNEDERFRADRCYAPDTDMAAALASAGIPLFSLELKKPLKEFDVVGFTLQHELCASNVVYMLDAAGIPLFSRERAGFPLIIGGGPLTMNPEPLADFFDAFVIGDGEDAIIEVLEAVARPIASGKSQRKPLLEALSGIAGVYVPSFYEPLYNDVGGSFAALRKVVSCAPDVVTKRVFDINSRPPVSSPVVPSAASVHSRLSVEIARGCPHNCAFCQAAVYYRPLRRRSPEVILEAVATGLKNTGYDEVSFASLSSGDYPGIAGLIEKVLAGNSFYPLSVALPSLHCDKFDDTVAAALAKSAARPSVTLAPEAGTHRLRKVIGKDISDDAVIAACSAARRAGWKQIKLYFMYGLPTETDEDIEGVASLVRRIRNECRGIGIKVSMSPFVPKPGTRLERAEFCLPEELRRRKDKLRKTLGGAFGSHDVEASFLEAVLARGDRRLAPVIADAYRSGARFDQWREHFRPELWLTALKARNLEPAGYANSASKGAPLPWSHISCAVAAPSAFKAAAVAVPAVLSPTAAPSVARVGNIKPLRFRIRLARRGLARFISHNDQIEIFRRAVRMARLPVGYSAGFHPQPKISFGPAVSVGHESSAEYMEAEFRRYLPPQEILERLSMYLPDGYSALSVRQIPTAFASLESLARAAEYTVFFDPPPDFPAAATAEFLSSAETTVEINGRSADLKKLVRSALWENDRLRLALNILPSGNVKPEKIAAHIFGAPPETMLVVRREKFYAVKKDGSLLEI